MDLEKFLSDPEQTLIELDRIECAESLATFVKRAWHVIEPSEEYIHGWHIDAIADHLEAVASGELRRLLITVPPGCMKSLMVSVMAPAWEWGPLNKPHLRIIGTAHNERLAIRDSLKMRRLITSEWYQARWGNRVQITSDQAAKTKYETSATGFREAMPFTSLTGSRGDRVLIDDPLSVDDAASEVKREAVNQTFLEAVPSRVTNPQKSAIVVIMQRLHQRDVAGVILEKEDLGYEHLMLPMEFEPERKCYTSIGFIDPREKEGELLFPNRYTPEVLNVLKASLGSFGAAGQLQQRPVPREGGACKRHWFEVVDAVPANVVRGRGWDLAASENETSAYTVGVKIARDKSGIFYIEDVRRFRAGPMGVENALVNTASNDGVSVPVSFPQDPGQAGKSQAQYLASKLAGYNVTYGPETGDKLTRGLPFAAQAEAGNVKIVRGDWNEVYLDEICMVPNSKYWDQWDATSRAFELVLKKQADYSNMTLGSIGKESLWRRV